MWMGIIFLFSSAPSLPQASSELLDMLIKKSAHFGEYAVLAILFYRALDSSDRRDRRLGLAALALAIGYAITDEIHQAFVPGRRPAIVDLGIDTAGSLMAMMALGVFRRGLGSLPPDSMKRDI